MKEKAETLRKILTAKKAVIFDFDNIIVDSEPYHYKAYSQVFASKGHIIDREEYWREWTSKGGGAESEIRRYNLDLDPAEIRKEKDPIYSAFCRNGSIKVFPESAEIIRLLHEKGFVLAVASGSYKKDIEAILSANNLLAPFDAIVGKDDILRYKPAPETYLRAAEQIHMAPSHCVAIEDAEKGIRSARGAGMSVIVIETDITRGLSLEGADLKLSGLAEFLALLKETL